jgi:sugar-specific transcriptional regulator TrmB
MIEKFLKEIGLSEKEVEVYLKLLTVNDATVTELSHLTQINRTTIYPILESLAEKKLVLEIEKGKKARFQAEQPERLTTYIQNKKSKLEEQEKLLDEVIPRIKSISMQSGEKPIVKVFDGREGILKSVEESFESGDTENTIYLIYPKDRLQEIFSEKERARARGSRIDRKIKSISIYSSEKEPALSDELSTRYKIDSKEYPIKCDISIYADRVRIHTLGDDLAAIFIKSKDVAETLRTLFKLAFKGIKKE